MKRRILYLITGLFVLALFSCNIFAPHEFTFINESSKSITVTPGEYQRWKDFTLDPGGTASVGVFINLIQFTYSETKYVLPEQLEKQITFDDKAPFRFYNHAADAVTVTPAVSTTYQSDWEEFTLSPDEKKELYSSMLTGSGNEYLDRHYNIPVFDYTYEDSDSVSAFVSEDSLINIFRETGPYFTVVNTLESGVHGVEMTSNNFTAPAVSFGEDDVYDSGTGSQVDGIASNGADTEYLPYDDGDYVTVRFTVTDENTTYRTGNAISIRSWDDRVYIISEDTRESWERVN